MPETNSNLSLNLQHKLSVGNTPLLDLSDLGELSKTVKVLAKAEWANPGGSVKDRAAAGMVIHAFENGNLAEGGTLIDATSGNTGIAYAWIGARLGFKVVLCVPDSVNAERRRILQLLNAELIFTDPLESTDGAICEVRRLIEANPGVYFYSDQYNNPENYRAHYATTGPEVWQQTNESITHFITGLGTTGTFRGTSTFLKEKNADIQVIAVQPDGPLHGLEGIKHMETAIVPGIHDPKLADATVEIRTEDAQALCRRTAKERGLLLGPSGAANLLAALRLGETLSNATIVTVLPDSGEHYLGDNFWDEA
ncbi:MAG: cysteine synthase [Elusimicrobia bacterium]|nr:MAG: cysteine synthase [Elusimicrobiota bacterium]